MRFSILLFLCTFFCATSIYAQNDEPDFIGDVYYKPSEGNVISLEKSPIQIKTKAGASVYIVGIGSAKTRMYVKGCCSSIRIPMGNNVQFIARAVDNQTDPTSIIQIFKFEKKKKERRAELGKASTFGGTSSNNLDMHNFSATKYGESSYLLSLSINEPGEYGIVISNPNALDQRATIIACFGVDE